ncbi:hypothetical protein EB008_02370 [bacterium]|nr:hypothetical protein [bacterium]
MSHPQNISGTPPKDPLEAGKNAPTPDKFKKVMGVESSAESDQRGAKNRYVKQDEEEAEEENEITAKPDIFSQLMSDKQTKEFSLGPSRQTTQEIENDEDFSKLPDQMATGADLTQTDSIQIKSTAGNPPSKDLLEAPLSEEPLKKNQEVAPPKKHDAFKELKKIEGELENMHPSKKPLPHKESVHGTQHKSEKKEKVEASPSVVKEQIFHPHKTPPDGIPHKSEKEKKGPRGVEQEKPPLIAASQEIAPKSFDETTIAPQPQITVEAALSPSLSASPPYAQFSPQIFELFQKLVGMMTVMQFQGKTTTSIILHLPSSPLDGAHVDIEHFDTAPHAFNITLYASVEGQKLLDPQVQNLEQQLRASLPNFQISVKKPYLLDETREEKKRRNLKVKKTG